ncbi:hypothetical protein [Thiocystis violacea]|uniref:hypothetical protein n=1 Tax=Thiocystis violacea TaxID=13725 RepID=UPI0019082FB4|nr:hypothetical protein [Thiocystis violacea]MBK1719200.1 hypothetical protein [Thiocystis violacea]
MPESTPKRLTRAQFARQERVARSTVTRWIQDGRITLGEDGLIDAEQGHAERLATESPLPKHQARKAVWDALKEGDGTDPTADAATGLPAAQEPPPAGALSAASDNAALGSALKFETWRLQQAKADLANLDLDRAAGLLVERAEIDFILVDYGTVVRDQLESLPDRLAPDLAACRGEVGLIHKTLGDAARQILEAVGQHLQRRLDGLGGAA